MTKIKILILTSVLFSCIWLSVLAHLSEKESHFEEKSAMITLVEKTEDEILYDKQVEFFAYDSIEIANETHRLSKQYDIPVPVICALILTESDGINGAVSSANCVGLTQVSEFAVAQYNHVNGTDYSLTECKDNIKINLEVGIWYYNWCVSQVKNTKYVYQNAYLMFNVGCGYYMKYYYDWVNGVNPISGKKYRALDRFKEKLEKSTLHFITY